MGNPGLDVHIDFLPEKREALARWADHIDALVKQAHAANGGH